MTDLISKNRETDGNPGAIAGAVVAVLLVTIVAVVVLVIFLR